MKIRDVIDQLELMLADGETDEVNDAFIGRDFDDDLREFEELKYVRSITTDRDGDVIFSVENVE